MKLDISRLIAAPALLASILLLGGCNSSKCEGKVEADGTCVALCDATKCGEGATCVDNKCAASCETHRECDAQTYCALIGDSSGNELGSFCVDLDLGDSNGVTGKYETCASDDHCDTARGFSCIDEKCVLPGCALDIDCGEVGRCVTAADGTTRYCDLIEGYEPLGPVQSESLGAECPDGSLDRAVVLAQDGTCADARKAIAICNTEYECTAETPDTACDTRCWRAEVEFYECISTYSPCDDTKDEFCIGGNDEGDPGRYCSRACTAAGEACSDGYGCGLARSSDAPCDEQCGSDGSSSPTCIASSDIGNGKAYECGHGQLLRSVCLRNENCRPCETDADCSAVPGQICAKDQSGAKICTQRCDPHLPTCPGGDEAECAIHDSDVGFETCAHRFGSCAAVDGAECAPCFSDIDCAGNQRCVEFISGSRQCIDLEFDCECDPENDPPVGVYETCNGGCPDAPSGMGMTCLDIGVGPGIKTCIGARVDPPPSPQGNPNIVIGCWPKINY